MRAVEYDRYGDPDALELRNVADPRPGAEEVLVRVRAVALNPKDLKLQSGALKALSGRRFPRRIGFDWSGEVVSAGPGVLYPAGTRLYGMLNGYAAGACAELVSARVDECAPAPRGLTFEQAAALPLVAQTALQGLRDHVGVRPGDALCIHGASGGVGTAAIQIARALRARVTSVSGEANLELCRELGAAEAFAYERDDPFAGKSTYDGVLDAFGSLAFARVSPALARRGRYVCTVPSLRLLADVARTSLAGRRARLLFGRSRRGDLEQVTTWVDAGQLHPVIDRVFGLEEARGALAYLARKRVPGKVVIVVP